MKRKETNVVIITEKDADAALAMIRSLRSMIDDQNSLANEKIDAARSYLVEQTKCMSEAIARYELALEAWASAHKDKLFKEPRSMQLNFGTVGFRWTPWKIVAIGKLKVATIIAKIKAAKLADELIRTKEEIDKEAALNYSAEDLAKCGLKKTRKDEFYYVLKTEEVR